MRAFRFGVNLSDPGKARLAEQRGYQAVTFGDHLAAAGVSPVFPDGAPAPFPALVAAAHATEKIRIGTLTLNAAFYNPVLLTREIGTVQGIVGDRFELGLGSGHMKSEFDDAGLPFEKPSARLARLERVLDTLDTRLTPEKRPRILIGGNSDRVLELAARRADAVGFAGLVQVPGQPPGTFEPAGYGAVAERVAFFADRAGARDPDIERNWLVQFVAITDDPTGAVAEWLGDSRPDLDVPSLLDKPQVLAGTEDEVAAKVVALRERFGLSYLTVMEPYLETFAPIVARLAGT